MVTSTQFLIFLYCISMLQKLNAYNYLTILSWLEMSEFF